ncbi:MAG: glycerophosphodiester phosphodiesterase, partial [Ignavibacteriae bacterium]|nr:glycerophosphodiester phosphodiesterase [Ignavibacteriota bacterium]
ADLDYTWYTKLLSPSVEKLIQMCKHSNLEGLNVWAGNLLTKTFVYKVRNSNLLLYTWTVDDSENAETLQSWGIDGITTNRANWLKNKIR